MPPKKLRALDKEIRRLRALDEKIWKILLEKGSGMIRPGDLPELLRRKGLHWCSQEDVNRALERLEEDRKIFFGTFYSIWNRRERGR